MRLRAVVAHRLADLVGGELADHRGPTMNEMMSAVRQASTARSVM
jgi:hypothetical protein